MYHATFDDYKKSYKDNTPFLYVKTIFADCETPVSLYSKLTQNQPYSFLFESVKGGEARARYTVIGYQPNMIWYANKDTAFLTEHNNITQHDTIIDTSQDIIGHLRAFIAKSHLKLPEFLPAIACGIYGYMSYDAIRYVEHIPDGNDSEFAMHDALYMRPDFVIVYDNVMSVIHFCYPIRTHQGANADEAWQQIEATINAEIDKLQRPLPLTTVGEEEHLQAEHDIAQEAYEKMVEKAKSYIKAGDIFQVVLSQRFRIQNFSAGDFAFYRSLRTMNPSPYMFYMNLPSYTIIGASPETMCRLEDKKITIRPLAGTRKRGQDKHEDATLSHDLLNDPKECAEHLMLLDLGRNDVGKASALGQVQVNEKFIIEYYSHVMHIVSNVEGVLREGLDAIDVLFAGMPAGTVSGAPKVRAMQIIEECEQLRRDFYAGCVGYFSVNGDMDHSITLRTALYDKKHKKLILQSGAGIVYDSIPYNEHQECINKAQALIKAAARAHHFTMTPYKYNS